MYLIGLVVSHEQLSRIRGPKLQLRLVFNASVDVIVWEMGSLAL